MLSKKLWDNQRTDTVYTYLKGSSFWITAESPDKVWIQVVRHNSPQDYSTVLFLTAVAQFRVLIRDSFLNIATATDERRDFRFSIHARLCRPFIKWVVWFYWSSEGAFFSRKIPLHILRISKIVLCTKCKFRVTEYPCEKISWRIFGRTYLVTIVCFCQSRRSCVRFCNRK